MLPQRNFHEPRVIFILARDKSSLSQKPNRITVTPVWAYPGPRSAFDTWCIYSGILSVTRDRFPIILCYLSYILGHLDLNITARLKVENSFNWKTYEIKTKEILTHGGPSGTHKENGATSMLTDYAKKGIYPFLASKIGWYCWNSVRTNSSEAVDS